jgi:hypothetical protein
MAGRQAGRQAAAVGRRPAPPHRLWQRPTHPRQRPDVYQLPPTSPPPNQACAVLAAAAMALALRGPLPAICGPLQCASALHAQQGVSAGLRRFPIHAALQDFFPPPCHKLHPTHAGMWNVHCHTRVAHWAGPAASCTGSGSPIFFARGRSHGTHASHGFRRPAPGPRPAIKNSGAAPRPRRRGSARRTFALRVATAGSARQDAIPYVSHTNRTGAASARPNLNLPYNLPPM